MGLEIHEGPWMLVIGTDHVPAAFVPTSVLRDSEPAVPMLPAAMPVRAVVELRGLFGGMRYRALLGAEFAPRPGSAIMFEVGHSGTLALGGPATCQSLIGETALVVGLPLEFAHASLDGLVRARCATPLAAGMLRVDRAGYDDVDSAHMVFERAGGLLCCVLRAAAGGDEPDEDELRRLVRG
jgi:hypothetical protein